ncbi:MAG: hypothetical protein NC819_02740 [Candidatus Omnitrophica bacterium]|nr:hypothetical protein [Candidatus Omnitrophota bacterium]
MRFIKRLRLVVVLCVLLSPVSLVAEEAPTPADEGAQAAPEAPTPAPETEKPSPAQPVAAVSETESRSQEFQGFVWVDDELPANAKQEGSWEWETAVVSSGERSHWHPAAQGVQTHGFSADAVLFPSGSMLRQQVWLDPQNPPKGIMLKLQLQEGSEVIGVYWEGEEEVFRPDENEEVWYYGLLPEFGKWVSLEVLAEDLGIEGEKISGLYFITYSGRALWDKTEFVKAPPLDESQPSLP